MFIKDLITCISKRSGMYRHKEEKADMKEGKKIWGCFPFWQNSGFQNLGYRIPQEKTPGSRTAKAKMSRKFWSRNKWNDSGSVEIFWSKWFTPEVVLGFDWSVRFDRNLPFHFQKIPFSSPTFLSRNQNFGRNANGLLRFDWTMLFNFS